MNCVLAFLAMMAASVVSLPVKSHWDAVIRHRRELANCQRPANIDELFQSLNNNILPDIYLRPKHDNAQQSLLDNELNNDQVIRSQSVFGTRTCPSSASTNPEDPIWMRSLCPWYYNVTETPAGHYPRLIPEAICQCSECIDNNVNQCEQVITNIRVLEETGCQDGFFTYKAKTIPLSVGCTCVKRRTTTVSPADSPSTSGAANPSPCGAWGCVSS